MKTLGCAVIVCALSLFAQNVAVAGTILLLGEDSDSGAFAVESRPVRSAADLLRGRLTSYGFDIYDEASVGVSLGYQPGLMRNETEVLEVARAMDAPPMDEVVVLSLYPQRSTTSFGSKYELRYSAKVLSVSGGRVIGSFVSRSLEPVPLPKRCDENCFLESVSEHVEDLALDLADQISRVVTGGSSAQECLGQGCYAGLAHEYKIVLRYPNTQIIDAFETRVLQDDLGELIPVENGAAVQSYWLKSDLKSLEVKRFLLDLREDLGAALQVRMSGNTFEVRMPN